MIDTLSLEPLVDGLIDAYVEWRDACGQVNDAYRCWAFQAGPRDRVAFGLYMAALDAEEHAAEAYAAFVMRAYKRLWGQEPAADAPGARLQEAD